MFRKRSYNKKIIFSFSVLVLLHVLAQVGLSYIERQQNMPRGLYQSLAHGGIFFIFMAALIWVLFSFLKAKQKEVYEGEISYLNANLKTTEEQLIRASKLATLGELATSVAHEVMNPLTVISSYCQLLQRKKENMNSQEVITYVDKISGEIFRVSRILREIQDYARPKKEESEFIDPDVVVNETLDMLVIDPRFKNIEIARELGKISVTCRMSREKFKQVLLNLFINAADAMPRGGVMIVKSDSIPNGSEYNHYILTVKDSGEGIPEGVAQKVFEPFFTTKIEGRGTGLGLAVSKRILSGFGGNISFTSKKNQGTTFTVDIPESSTIH